MSHGYKHSCFVTVIRDNPNTSKGDVHIQLNYGNRLDGFIAGAVVLSAIVLIVLVLLIVMIALALKHTKIE